MRFRIIIINLKENVKPSIFCFIQNRYTRVCFPVSVFITYVIPKRISQARETSFAQAGLASSEGCEVKIYSRTHLDL